MNIFAISGLINGFTSITLGSFVIFKHHRNTVNRSFFLMSLVISLWSFGYWGWMISDSRENALFWVRFLSAWSILIPVLYLYWILTLLGIEKKRKYKRVLLVLASLSAFFLVCNFTPLFIEELKPKLSFQFWPEPGILYPLFLITFSFVAVYSVFLLAASLKKVNQYKRNQLKYVLLGTVAGFSGGSTNFPLWFDIPLKPYGNLFVFLYVMILTYAVLRYRLMDIRLALKKGVVYSLSAGVLTSIFIILVLAMTNFLAEYAGITSFGITVTGALLIAILFNPLKTKIQSLLDGVFHKTTYDYYATIKKTSHQLAEATDADDIRRFIVDTVFTTLKVKSVYLLSSENKYFYPVCFRTSKEQTTPEKGLPDHSSLQTETEFNVTSWRDEGVLRDDSELVKLLKVRDDIIIRGELARRISHETADRVAEELQPLQGEAVAPIFIDNNLAHLLVLSEKMSGDIFSDNDINLMNTIAHQAALALKNAALYAEKIQSERLASIGLMAATLAHEIKNPLASIKVFTQLIPDKYYDSEFRESFSKIVTGEIERIDGLVTELLDFSKPTHIQFSKVPARELLDDTLELIKEHIERCNIIILKKYGRDYNIAGDSVRLKQALLNILINSHQAMESGGTLEVGLFSGNNSVHISICDSGPGIPEEIMDKIFDPFFTTKQRGAGLGLAISKKIIEDHGGTLVAGSSSRGAGTRFLISLASFERAQPRLFNGNHSTLKQQR